MNFLDLLVIAAAAAAGWIGYRMGFVRRVASWAGLAGGVVLAIVLVDNLAEALRASPPRTRLLGALAFVLLIATIGHAVGYAVGTAVHNRLGARAGIAMHRSDRVAGAIVGVTGVLALMWLLIPALASSPGWPARAVRDSAVARAIDRIAPDPPPDAETLGRLVGDETFPEVFDTLTSPDAGTPPQHGVPGDVAQRVSNSVVKVEGTACDRVQEGTGFVAAPGIIVTNAHVVAGEQRTKVFTVDGTQIDTDVVAFDPNRDLAVLQVSNLDCCTTRTRRGPRGRRRLALRPPRRRPPARVVDAHRRADRRPRHQHRAHRRHPPRGLRARRRHRTRRLRRPCRRSERQSPRRPLRLRPRAAPPPPTPSPPTNSTQSSTPSCQRTHHNPVSTGPCLSE